MTFNLKPKGKYEKLHEASDLFRALGLIPFWMEGAAPTPQPNCLPETRSSPSLRELAALAEQQHRS